MDQNTLLTSFLNATTVPLMRSFHENQWKALKNSITIGFKPMSTSSSHKSRWRVRL
jgi:hypothetical protein